MFILLYSIIAIFLSFRITFKYRNPAVEKAWNNFIENIDKKGCDIDPTIILSKENQSVDNYSRLIFIVSILSFILLYCILLK